jgi:predicted transcriptional regulator
MARKLSLGVDRDQQILNRLSKIEHRVDSIDQTQAFALRAEPEKHFKVVKTIFKNGKRRAQIYLAANGSRGVEEIAKHLGMQRQNVGRELKFLGGQGMLEIKATSGGRDIWGKKQIDHSLGINQFLQKEYSLSPDGRSIGIKKVPSRKS